MFSRVSVLFVTILMVLCVCVAFADTGAAASATPWWAELITILAPMLVVFVTKEIRSHMKDATIERLATLASTAKKYEPLAADILAAIEAKYPTLKADVAKVEQVVQSPVGQIAVKATEQVAAGVTAPQA